MKWIKLFESYSQETKLAKANEIFGLWLMCKILRTSLHKEEYDDNGTIITNYFTATGKKVIRIKWTSTETIISVLKAYRSKKIRDFLTKCGFANPDGREYWDWYNEALKKIYNLPDWIKIQILYEVA